MPSNRKQAPAGGLGRSLILSRERMRPSHQFRKEKHMKPGALGDEKDCDGEQSGAAQGGQIKSITAESSLDEFISRAALANLDLAARQEDARQIMIDTQNSHAQLVGHKPVMKPIEEIPSHLLPYICIPRRPPPPDGISWKDAGQLKDAEEKSFLEWRRNLATVQETHSILLTPFERNLEMWRQLWRAVERCDVLVQIVDARAPLLFWCEDLDRWANKEMRGAKKVVLLVNKADLITPAQRKMWAQYFNMHGMEAMFWSAADNLPEMDEHSDDGEQPCTADSDAQSPPVDPTVSESGSDSAESENECDDNEIIEDDNDDSWVTSEDSDSDDGASANDLNRNEPPKASHATSTVSARILSSQELMDSLFSLAQSGRSLGRAGEKPVIGMFGYPNVGKSSTINKLMGVKKTAVSATPGKTRHLQTLHLSTHPAVLLDCPGLVPPSVAMSHEHMLLNGILPVDSMRDCVAPTSLALDLIQSGAFESAYGVAAPDTLSADDSTLPVAQLQMQRGRTFLSRVAFAKGFMTQAGVPDVSRAGRVVVKDIIGGRLRLCTAPPNTSQTEYDKAGATLSHSEPGVKPRGDAIVQQMEKRKLAPDARPGGRQFDDEFFRHAGGQAHVKGARMNKTDSKKHHNRNKKGEA